MKFFASLLFLLFYTNVGLAQFLADKEKQSFTGFFNFHYTESDGKLYLEVNALDQEFLYMHALSTGVGSNDIGLDRGQIGDGVVVKFIKSGNTLLLIQPNLKYRANTTNAAEKKSIEQAFATSVLYGFPIKETSNETYLIDITPFLIQDTHGVIQRLKNTNQGSYKLDASRSSVWMEQTKAFPKNIEFEALITYKGTPKGREIYSVAPDASSVSVIQHHSFIELPKDDYIPRAFDPRSGSLFLEYLDYATPVWEPIRKKVIARHRLSKKNPLANKSEAVEPIIYYLDPGTPEPVRSALLEGAQWWNQAFEAIGYIDAFQVKMLPDGVDPLDIRYNVIQWVHRSTRGWSYGASIKDPRTGEILKGHVSLGSLRIRQDYLLAQGLSNSPFKDNSESKEPMLSMALARIRQLAAHEVGHTLGFAHNFAGSSVQKSTVMDYPHPDLKVKNNDIDFSNAYATGIGSWDKVTVAYAYGDYPKDEENARLRKLLDSAFANGHKYISDQDARAKGGANSTAHLWDNGNDPIKELEEVLKVRSLAISNFSTFNEKAYRPLATLEDVFVPVYFYHRYQTEALVKSIGGIDYSYNLNQGEQNTFNVVAGATQKKALDGILKTIEVETLSIPENLVSLFSPRPPGFQRTRESFKSTMGVSFDALNAPATSAEFTVKLLLHPERANRLIQQKAIEKNNLSLDDVLDALCKASFHKTHKRPYKQEVQNAINYVVFQQLLALGVANKAMPQVKEKVYQKLDEISKMDTELSLVFKKEIEQYYKNPEKFKVNSSPKIPDGSPIGSFSCSINE